jgi:hypothetical protein
MSKEYEQQKLIFRPGPKTVILIYSLSHDCVLSIVGGSGDKVAKMIVDGHKKNYPDVKSKKVTLE